MWQQKQNIDIPFNFLIGGDGRAYRGGLSDQQIIRSNNSVSIAFIGKLCLMLDKRMPKTENVANLKCGHKSGSIL